ncbi:MAG: SpoIID/LytB domain-containing protein [Candidatus Limnocylindrales bacterium]
MRRPQPVRGLVAVLSSLLVVTAFAVPASAAIQPAAPEASPAFDASSKTCTKWASTLTPPRTVRVLRTAATSPGTKVKGTVQTVDFYEYVATVMAAEWPERYPIETIKAGAMATKQFAWFYIKYPRGGTKWKDGEKHCYDVVDSTVDQWYRPEKFGPGTDLWPAEGSKIRQAMDLTWDQSLRKFQFTRQSSRFFLTGYRAGSGSATCGSDRNGFKLFHNSTRKCGYDGLKYQEILRLYLNPRLEIVTPGASDVIGTKHGDAALMRHTSGQRTPRVWTPGRTPPDSNPHMGISLATDSLIDYASGDLNGDGRDDLVWLKKTGPSAGRVKVALSDGADFGGAQDWWSGDTIVPVNGAELLVGDFHADGRNDVAIFGRGTSEGSSRMVVLRRAKYTNAKYFNDPVLWWEAGQAFDKVASVWLADVSGDGRSDLVVRQNGDGGGVRIKTAVTKSPLPKGMPRMGTYKRRWEDKTLIPSKVKMAVGDANRDGRDDVMMLVGGGGRAVVERLQGGLLGGFKRVRLWTAPKSDPIPVEKTRLAASDFDYDGREDWVLFTKRGSGTRIRILEARYDKVIAGPDWKVYVPWTDIRPL